MQELKIHGVYKHFKGDYYLVEDIAKDSETKEEINRSNRVIEEKELDDSKYYSELGDIEERFDGLEIGIEQKLVVNGDLYIIEYVCSYDYDNVAYDVDKVWLYSERDDKWFSDDDDFVDVVNARYPEIW